MGGFGYHRRSRRVIATFSVFEADLLRSLASQLVELLHDGSLPPEDDKADPLEAMLDFTGPTSEPDDPVLARLFPSAYPGDEEAASEFRRFTEGSLRDGKAANARSIITELESAGLPAEIGDEQVSIDVELDLDTASGWLRSFTDIRLALATRLGIEQDDEEHWGSLPEDDPRLQVYGIYQWLGALQETLVDAISDS